MTWLLYATGARDFSLSPSDDFSWWVDVGIGAVSPVKQSSHPRRQAASQVRRYGRSCWSSRVTRHHAPTAGACLLQPFSLVSAPLVPLMPPQ